MKKQVLLTALALATAVSATAAHAGDVKVKGKVYFNYSTHSATGKANETAGDVKRTYITIKKKVDDVWSTRVTLDSSIDGNTKKSNNVFLKYAYLKGKFSDAVQVKMGIIATPWVGYEDKMNEHRYISKSFVDTHKMASSADAGLGVQGKAGMFSYDLVSINGGGYGSTAKTEKTDIETRFGIKPIEGLTFDIGYRDGYNGKFVATVTETKNTLTQLMATYGGEVNNVSYRVAFNSISNKVEDQIANTTVTEKGTEIWAMARMGQFGGYLRNESFDRNVTGKVVENRTVVSLDYHATKGVVISLDSDKTTDSKGIAGDEKSTTGLFTQFKF